MPFLDFQLRLSWKTAGKWALFKGISLLYAALLRLRMLAYRSKAIKRQSVGINVVSVGNITVGGTGKTPMIDWFLDFCSEVNLRPAVLTRGYGARRKTPLQILNQDTASRGSSDNFGDEPWFLYKNHPQYSYYISPNRVLAARVAEKSADVIFLDDGMQHLRLHRDLDIVLIDATTGIGNGQIVPLGPLREPLSELFRADIIVYTKTNLSSSSSIRKELLPFLPNSVHQFDSEYLPIGLDSSTQQSSLNVEEVKGKKCLLFSGIGNPIGFEWTVRQAGGKIIQHLVLDDHQKYDQAAIRRIEDFIRNYPYDLLICTEKDWTKLENWKDHLPNFYRLKMKLVMDREFVSFFRKWMFSEKLGSNS